MPGDTCLNLWLGLGVALWLGLALVGWLSERSPPSPRPDLATGLAALLVRIYLRVVHGMRVEGRENLAAAVNLLENGRPLVVTANHAAGIDPLLVQAPMPVFIRWLVAADTVAPNLRSFVEFADVIFISGVGREVEAASKGEGGEMAGVREAIRYLKGDPAHPLTQGRPGVVGVFPEGRIVRRRGAITPFQPGAGLLIGKSRAVVLPVVLSGVPIRGNTYQAFFIPSRSTVSFMPPIDYSGEGKKTGEIIPDLQSRYEKWVGPVVPAKGRERK